MPEFGTLMTFVLIMAAWWMLVWVIPYFIAAVRVRRSRGRWHWQIKRERDQGND